jgi:hypothetical protein
MRPIAGARNSSRKEAWDEALEQPGLRLRAEAKVWPERDSGFIISIKIIFSTPAAKQAKSHTNSI